MKNFVHLHVHSEYSLLDGLSKAKKMIPYLKENDMNEIAITDHGVMYGLIEFYKKCREEGVKLIAGMEAYTTDEKLGSKPEKGKPRNYHLLLLAKNEDGYKNLMKISSLSHLEGYYYRPRIDKENLKKYSGGLIATSACAQGELSQAILENDEYKIKKNIKFYQNVFKDNYYLEIQRHKYEDSAQIQKNSEIKRIISDMADNEKKINERIFKLSREYGIPLVATNDSHYLKKEDATAQDLAVCVATGKKVDDINRLRFIDTPTFHLATPTEMQELFIDLPEALENTCKISKKCNLEISTFGKWYFPAIEMPKGKSAVDVLKEKALSGLKEKYTKITDELKYRIEYELKVIIDKGYSEYFLIFEDMSRWAYENKIPINTRGSAAGSLVSYCLGITTVDPIRYLLPFERFLNPFRPSAPDIDMDISDTKRESMISYLKEKYGKEKVAQICTFGRMLARGSVRDVARVLGYPYLTGDRIAKLIPIGSQGFPMTISRALEESRELKDYYDNDKDAKKIINLSMQIEGNARHISVHAAGIVISPSSITDFTPIQKEPSGDKIITQYEMHSCEDVGLIKLDVLGIRNLSILEESIHLVKKVEGIDVDIRNIPLDDPRTFEMLSKGNTFGVFQLGGAGMTKYLMDLVPERIEDIMIMIAAYRPGPIANIPEFIARKKGKKKTTYFHPKMEKFLDKSFGILVYQDDLLYTALEVAGYNWEEVDKFRKAVGKKIPEEMAKQHEIFVLGCQKHSAMTKDEAEKLWELFEPFQGYGFNKAHAASYGMFSYQTAYMKANYPVEYMCALLAAESSDKDKVTAAINECRRMGIVILPPDINESHESFVIVNNKDSLQEKGIRFGLNAIKNVGDAAIKAIIKARHHKPFMNINDFLKRVDTRKVNKKVIESLIKVGAFSDWGTRKYLLENLEEIRSKITTKKDNKNQQGLFTSEDLINDEKLSMGILSSLNTNESEFTKDELVDFEKQLLGFTLSAKPINEILGNLQEKASHKINEVSEFVSENDFVTIAVVVKEVRIIITKRSGQEMAFVKAEDTSGSIDLVIFPSVFEKFKNILADNRPYLVNGKISKKDEDTSILVDELILPENLADKVFIKVPQNCDKTKLLKLNKLLLANKGDQVVSLKFEGSKESVDLPYKISWNETLAKMIDLLFEEVSS